MNKTTLISVVTACALLSACASSAGIVAAAPGPDQSLPTDAPVEVASQSISGPQMNALGGEIPKTAPTTAIGETAIADARSN